VTSLSYPLAFLAGLVSIFSPCVLPLLPVVLGTAVSQHRLGPVALAAGLSLSFLAIGLFVATVGFSLGLDSDAFRNFGAVLLVAIGATLMLPPLQARLALAAGPLVSLADAHFGTRPGRQLTGLQGQFGVGVLLGAVWSPCVGPTLGAASVLAAQGKDLPAVTLTMLLFVLGVAVPLLLLGLLSREALLRWRGKMLASGSGGKTVLGVILLATGALLLSGLDKSLETALLDMMPAWLNDVATRF
jgi:cytochrome c-type biogenesis protein